MSSADNTITTVCIALILIIGVIPAGVASTGSPVTTTTDDPIIGTNAIDNGQNNPTLEPNKSDSDALRLIASNDIDVNSSHNYSNVWDVPSGRYNVRQIENDTALMQIDGHSYTAERAEILGTIADGYRETLYFGVNISRDDSDWATIDQYTIYDKIIQGYAINETETMSTEANGTREYVKLSGKVGYRPIKDGTISLVDPRNRTYEITNPGTAKVYIGDQTRYRVYNRRVVNKTFQTTDRTLSKLPQKDGTVAVSPTSQSVTTTIKGNSYVVVDNHWIDVARMTEGAVYKDKWLVNPDGVVITGYGDHTVKAPPKETKSSGCSYSCSCGGEDGCSTCHGTTNWKETWSVKNVTYDYSMEHNGSTYDPVNDAGNIDSGGDDSDDDGGWFTFSVSGGDSVSSSSSVIEANDGSTANSLNSNGRAEQSSENKPVSSGNETDQSQQSEANSEHLTTTQTTSDWKDEPSTDEYCGYTGCDDDGGGGENDTAYDDPNIDDPGSATAAIVGEQVFELPNPADEPVTLKSTVNANLNHDWEKTSSCPPVSTYDKSEVKTVTNVESHQEQIIPVSSESLDMQVYYAEKGPATTQVIFEFSGSQDPEKALIEEVVMSGTNSEGNQVNLRLTTPWYAVPMSIYDSIKKMNAAGNSTGTTDIQINTGVSDKKKPVFRDYIDGGNYSLYSDYAATITPNHRQVAHTLPEINTHPEVADKGQQVRLFSQFGGTVMVRRGTGFENPVAQATTIFGSETPVPITTRLYNNTDFQLNINGSTVRGQLVDEDGTGVPNRQVQLSGMNSSTVTTDGNGNFTTHLGNTSFRSAVRFNGDSVTENVSEYQDRTVRHIQTTAHFANVIGSPLFYISKAISNTMVFVEWILLGGFIVWWTRIRSQDKRPE